MNRKKGNSKMGTRDSESEPEDSMREREREREKENGKAHDSKANTKALPFSIKKKIKKIKNK